MYKKYIKRFLDLFLSVAGIIIVSPVLLITAMTIKIDSKGPIIFKQKRLGQYGKEFYIYKFRTMCVGAENMGSKQYSYKADPRITRVGRVLRATSIDELPQLVNILKSDMSLIGFRPPLTYHPYKFDEYTEEQKEMFKLKPGITGWAQIHGRKGLNWSDRISMNVWYAKNVSFKVDIIIFFTTVWKVLLNKDNVNVEKTV
ncbi:MAG: sugar transferase [Tyzzerella sp.]|nr:sugar transferase [Tyzzerella sp.]